MWSGDIRRLQAVDVPALHKLKNVIVFPRKGLRPHASEMSGGDLDGDTFWICHDKQLIFSANEEPFDYQDQAVEAEKKAQEESSRPFSIEEVCNFFGEYIAADKSVWKGDLSESLESWFLVLEWLPTVIWHWPTSHLWRRKMRDVSPWLECTGTDRRTHPHIVQLLSLSVAVDFAKNGVSAPRLTKDLRPKLYPHFMEKKDKPSYPSTTILGKLYDYILSCNIDLNKNRHEEMNEAIKFPYRSFHVAGNEEYMTDADFTKNEYERELRRVMRQYGIEDEVEIVSGYILKFNSKQYNNQTKLFELRNEIAHAYRVIRDK